MESGAAIHNGRAETVRVSTLELFFDLVFVFTATQLTAVLSDRFDVEALLQVVLMLGLIWWMYGGYAWLTNALAPDTAARRLLLLGGMGAYLTVALAIPAAFSDSGLAFGLGYLVVVLVHAGLYSSVTSTRLVRVAPYNLVAALAVLAGGIIGGEAQYVIWALAVALEWITPRLIDDSGFEIAPAHFVERHGLVVIVAIGESIVVIGVGAAGLAVDLPLVLVASLGLALSACLWWTYFGGDDRRAEDALTAAPRERRPRLAIDAFGYAHYLLLLGIVAIAAAEKKAIGHAFDALSLEASLGFGAGLAAFLAGDVLFRRALAIGRIDIRLGAAVLALATVPLGTEVAAVAQLAALVGLMAATFAIDRAAAPAASPPIPAG